MKGLLFTLLVCAVVIALSEAARNTRYRYRSSNRNQYNRYNRYDRYNRYNDEKKEEVADEKEPEVKEPEQEVKDEAPREKSKRKKDKGPRVHPCAEIKCDPGQECDVNDDGKATCQCIETCPHEEGPRVQVCTSRNVTFANECEFHRMKCMCQNKEKGCERHRYRNAHLDYYGECTEIKECQEHEMDEFPKRMRTWLFLIMEELDNRNTLNEEEHDMVMEAKRHSKKWLLPVIWKFCTLDKTHDRSITADELQSITAPLKPLEHCTGPFLEKCDANDDGTITLVEWGSCLGLEKDEVLREDRCNLIRRSQPEQ